MLEGKVGPEEIFVGLNGSRTPRWREVEEWKRMSNKIKLALLNVTCNLTSEWATVLCCDEWEWNCKLVPLNGLIRWCNPTLNLTCML